MKTKRRISPALVLFFLAPAVGELLSGSAPPVEFFNPFMFLILAVLYGSGAILARELVHRWGKGWPSLLALGGAYGIIEEGLMVKSFFDPGWEDLGILGTYGRMAGVNWVWSLELTLYHAVFSIAIPVLLVGLIFPEQQDKPWISSRTFKWLRALFVVDGILIYFGLTDYQPPFFPYLLAIAAVVGLCRLARRLPSQRPLPEERQPVRPRWFGVAGFFGTVAFFFISWGLPGLGVPVIGTFLLLGGLPFLLSKVLQRMSGQGPGWPRKHLWALISGALAFFVLVAPLQEMDPERLDNTSGMVWVGLSAVLLLAWLGRNIWRTGQSQATEGERTVPDHV